MGSALQMSGAGAAAPYESRRMTSTDRLPPADLAAAVTVVVLWGLNFVAAKEALAVLPSFVVMTLRFIGVGLLLAPFFRPAWHQLPLLALMAACLGIGHFGLLYMGMEGTDAASAAVMVQLGVPFSVLLAWAVFGENPGWRQLAGIAVAFSGVALLAGDPDRPRVLPMVIICVSMMMWAVSNVMVKRLGKISPLALNGWMSLLAVPMALSVSLLTEDHQIEAIASAGWKVWAGLAFTTLASSVVAYTLWYRLLSRYTVGRIVPFTLLGPVVGFAGGVFVLGEPPTPYKVAGGLLTVAGVALVELWRGPRS
jgi:O-acetylserine/cysteine efflux transporter